MRLAVLKYLYLSENEKVNWAEAKVKIIHNIDDEVVTDLKKSIQRSNINKKYFLNQEFCYIPDMGKKIQINIIFIDLYWGINIWRMYFL